MKLVEGLTIYLIFTNIDFDYLYSRKERKKIDWIPRKLTRLKNKQIFKRKRQKVIQNGLKKELIRSIKFPCHFYV